MGESESIQFLLALSLPPVCACPRGSSVLPSSRGMWKCVSSVIVRGHICIDNFYYHIPIMYGSL